MATKPTHEEQIAEMRARLAIKREGTVTHDPVASIDEAVARYHHVLLVTQTDDESVFPERACLAFVAGCAASDDLAVQRIGILCLLDVATIEAARHPPDGAWLVLSILGDAYELDPDLTVQGLGARVSQTETFTQDDLTKLRQALVALIGDPRLVTSHVLMPPSSEYPNSPVPRRWLQAIRRATRSRRGGFDD